MDLIIIKMKRLIFIILVFCSLFAQAQNMMFYGHNQSESRIEIDIVMDSPAVYLSGFVTADMTLRVFERGTTIPHVLLGDIDIDFFTHNLKGTGVDLGKTTTISSGNSSKYDFLGTTEGASPPYDVDLSISINSGSVIYDIQLLNTPVTITYN